jgi:hypothetical protein
MAHRLGDMPLDQMPAIAVGLGIETVEIGCTNWSSAPRILAVEPILGYRHARNRWKEPCSRFRLVGSGDVRSIGHEDLPLRPQDSAHKCAAADRDLNVHLDTSWVALGRPSTLLVPKSAGFLRCPVPSQINHLPIVEHVVRSYERQIQDTGPYLCAHGKAEDGRHGPRDKPVGLGGHDEHSPFHDPLCLNAEPLARQPHHVSDL